MLSIIFEVVLRDFVNSKFWNTNHIHRQNRHNKALTHYNISNMWKIFSFCHNNHMYVVRSVCTAQLWFRSVNKVIDLHNISSTSTQISIFLHILMALFNLEKDPSLLFSFVACTYSGSYSGVGNFALKNVKMIYFQIHIHMVKFALINRICWTLFI